MANHQVFTCTDPKLHAVLEELKLREPIFHTPHFGKTPADYAKVTAPSYWEVGASGRRYSREFILRSLVTALPDATAAGWETYDHSVRELGPDTYLFTYTLQQTERLTRRSTIWQLGADGWHVLYHQGTIVQAEEDDSVPTPEEIARSYPPGWAENHKWRTDSADGCS